MGVNLKSKVKPSSHQSQGLIHQPKNLQLVAPGVGVNLRSNVKLSRQLKGNVKPFFK